MQSTGEQQERHRDDPAVIFDSVSVTLAQRRIVHGVTATVMPGMLTGLIGPNGAGKTTLMRALVGLVPASGRITIGRCDAASLNERERARMLAYLPQESTVHWPLRVRDVVGLGRLPHVSNLTRLSERDETAIAKAMRATNVAQFADRSVTALSAGERARVMLARAVACETPILLADEPIAHLDPYFQLEIMELLAELASSGRTVLTVLHDLALTARFCGFALLMSEGVLLASGPPRDILTEENLARSYRVAPIGGAYENPSLLTASWQRLSRPHHRAA